MAVKAKFFVAGVEVNQINESGTPGAGRVRMSPVTRGALNREWAQATPSGSIEMYVNGPAIAWFMGQVGSELAITFDSADSDPATHEFAEWPEDQRTGQEYYDETCATCGHAKAQHSQ